MLGKQGVSENWHLHELSGLEVVNTVNTWHRVRNILRCTAYSECRLYMFVNRREQASDAATIHITLRWKILTQGLCQFTKVELVNTALVKLVSLCEVTAKPTCARGVKLTVTSSNLIQLSPSIE